MGLMLYVLEMLVEHQSRMPELVGSKDFKTVVLLAFSLVIQYYDRIGGFSD